MACFGGDAREIEYEVALPPSAALEPVCLCGRITGGAVSTEKRAISDLLFDHLDFVILENLTDFLKTNV